MIQISITLITDADMSELMFTNAWDDQWVSAKSPHYLPLYWLFWHSIATGKHCDFVNVVDHHERSGI